MKVTGNNGRTCHNNSHSNNQRPLPPIGNLRHKRKRMKKITLLLLGFALASCSGVRVLNAEANDGFALSHYKTFSFYKLEGSGDTTSHFAHNAALLQQSIATKLKAKGLQQTDTNPDLLVNVGIVVTEKIQTRETTLRDAPVYVGQRNYSWKSEEIEVGRYKEGTVTVHLVEPATNKLMWKGAVEGVLPGKQSKLPAAIEESMTTLFAKL